jgi:hypothetical protein
LASRDSHVVIISSSPEKVSHAVTRLRASSPENSHIEGIVVSVTDSDKYVETLLSLAPIDHLVYSAIDFIFRGPLDEVELSRAKEAFDIKFWGAVTSVNGMSSG